MLCDPLAERCEAFSLDSVDSPSTTERCVDQPGGLQQLKMLDNSRARNRQASREFASGHGRSREPLKNNHPDRVAEQSKYAQRRSELRRMRMRFGHVRSVTPD
jgi:hypothetical protein